MPGIIGYNGTGLTVSAGTDPQTILLDGSLTPVTVLANQTNTGLNTGVAEFQLANPTIALQGDNTASAPHIVIYLDTTGRSNIHVGYNLRDIDGSNDNAAQQVALQYRVGSLGNYTNIPAGYVADATTQSQATQVTPVSVTLPAAADNQSLVQLRIITSRATTNQKDEWVGVDDIAVTSTPTASSQSVATDAAKTITLGGTDADGDNLTYAVASAPTNGTLGAIGTPTCTGTAPKTCQPNVTYTPNAGFNGADSFQFRVNDGTVNSANATVSVNVEPVSDSPVAANDTATTDEDTAAVIDVKNNDTPGPVNESGQTLTVTSVTDPAKGTAEIITTGANAGKVRYTPDDNYSGTDSFGYTVCDNGTPSKCATATVNVNVTAVGDAPVARNDSYNAKQKKTLKIKAPGVLQNDEDVDSTNLSVQVVQGPTKGTLTLKNDGSFTYKPKGGFKGQDSFTYKVSDGAKESNTATVTITVK